MSSKNASLQNISIRRVASVLAKAFKRTRCNSRYMHFFVCYTGTHSVKRKNIRHFFYAKLTESKHVPYMTASAQLTNILATVSFASPCQESAYCLPQKPLAE